MSGFHGLPVYEMKSGDSEFAVFHDGVLFRIAGNVLRIARKDLVGAVARPSKDTLVPDTILILMRDKDGDLQHIKWSLADKGKTAEVTDAMYTIIDGRFWKSIRAMGYILTHKT